MKRPKLGAHIWWVNPNMRGLNDASGLQKKLPFFLYLRGGQDRRGVGGGGLARLQPPPAGSDYSGGRVRAKALKFQLNSILIQSAYPPAAADC